MTVLRQSAAETLTVQTKAVSSIDAAKIASREPNAWGQRGALGTDRHDDGAGGSHSGNSEKGQWEHGVAVEIAPFLRTAVMALAVLEDGCLSDGVSLGEGSTAGGRCGGVVTQIVTETREALASLRRSAVALFQVAITTPPLSRSLVSSRELLDIYSLSSHCPQHFHWLRCPHPPTSPQGLGDAYFSTVESVEKSLFLVLNGASPSFSRRQPWHLSERIRPSMLRLT